MISLAECLNTALPRENSWQTRLARGWPDAVGDLATRMRLEKINGSQLVIGVYDSHWISELFMLAPGIIQEINNFLGGSYITQIRFVIANQTNKKTRSFSHDCREPIAPVIMTARQEQILSSIKDRQLHDALEKFFYASVR